MSDGDMKMEEAAELQTFTGRKDCGAVSKGYTGKKNAPDCYPMCDRCLSIWLANIE